MGTRKSKQSLLTNNFKKKINSLRSVETFKSLYCDVSEFRWIMPAWPELRIPSLKVSRQSSPVNNLSDVLVDAFPNIYSSTYQKSLPSVQYQCSPTEKFKTIALPRNFCHRCPQVPRYIINVFYNPQLIFLWRVNSLSWPCLNRPLLFLNLRTIENITHSLLTNEIKQTPCFTYGNYIS